MRKFGWYAWRILVSLVSLTIIVCCGWMVGGG